MIFNYDKSSGVFGLNGKNLKNAGKSIKDFFTKKQDIVKNYTPTKNEGEYFARLEKLKSEGKDLTKAENIELTQTWANELDSGNGKLIEYSSNVEASKQDLGEYAHSQQKVIQGTTKFKSVLTSVGNVVKSVGASMLSMGISAVASWAIGKTFEGIYNWVHKTDNLIKASEEAKDAIDSTFKSFEDGNTSIKDMASGLSDSTEQIKTTSDAIDSIGQKYAELKQGVNDKTNENVSLSTEDYQQYINLSNQLAEQSPSLVSKYDDQGNAILNLGDNADKAADKLKKLYDSQMLVANVDIGENLQTTIDGTLAKIDRLTDEIGSLDTQSKSYSAIGEEYSDQAANGLLTKGTNAVELKNASTEYEKNFMDFMHERGYFPNVIGSSENGNGTVNITYQVDGIVNLSDDEFDKLNEDTKSIPTKEASSTSTEVSLLLNKSSADDLQKADLWKSIQTAIGQYVQTSQSFNNLNGDLQTAFLSGLDNLDFDTFKNDYKGDIVKFIYDAFLTPMSNLDDEAQEKLTDLITLDPSKMNLSDYKQKISDILTEVFKEDTEAAEKWKKSYGIDNTLQEYEDTIDKIKNTESIVESIPDNSQHLFPYIVSQFTTEDLETAKGILDNGFDGTLNELISKIKEVEKASAEAKSNTTLSSLLGDTSDEGFSKKVDTFQSDISSLTTTMQSLKTGDFKESDLTDLMQEFPQLVGKTDDLQSALSKIKTDKVKSIFKDLDDSLGNATATELRNAKDFKKELLKSVDFSDTEVSDIQEALIDPISKIVGSSSSSLLYSQINGFLNKYTAMLTTGTGRDAFYKALLIDPELFKKNQEEVIKAWQDNMPTAKDLIQNEDFQSEISNYQDDFKALYDAQKTLKTGLLDGAAKKTLFDRFPELAGHTEDLASAIDDLMDSTKNDALDSFQDKIDALKSAGDIEGANALQDYVDAVISGAEDIENAYQKIANLKIPTPQYAALKEAESTANSGDLYNDLLSQYKTAKEAWKKGEVGTDDFKSFAALISPTGVADAINFGENSKTFERYFEDTSQGVENFLEDLEKLNLASNESGHWTSTLGNNLDEMKNAAQQLGIGFEPFMMLFGRAEDYGATTDFFTTAEEGQQHLSDLYEQIADKKLQLAKIKTDPDLAGNQTAIDELNQDLDELYARVQNTSTGIEELPEKAKHYEAENLEQAKSVVSQMQDDINQAIKDGNEEQAKTLEQARDQYLKENGYVLLPEQQGPVKKGTIESPLTRDFSDTQDLDNYETVISKIQNASEQQKSSLEENFKVLSQYSESQLSGINLSDGTYDSGLENAEMALDNLSSAFGLTKEQAVQLAAALSDMGLIKTTPEVNLTTLDEQLKNTDESLKKIEKDSNIHIDLDIDPTSMTPDEIDKKAEELREAASGLEKQGYTDEAKRVTDTATNLEDYSRTVRIQEIVEKDADADRLQQLIDSGDTEQIKAEFGITVNGEDQLEKVNNELAQAKANKDAQIDMTVKLDESQFNQLTGDGQTSTITIKGDNKPAKESANDAKKYADGKIGIITINGNKFPAETAANEAVGYINGQSGNITIGAKTDTLISDINQALNKQDFHVNVTANVNANVNGGSTGGGTSGSKSSGKEGKASGTFTSIAHANGTAYNVLNYSPAHADGNIALSSDESALVNELGTESLVRQGKWMLIPGGAHFQSLKKGDIIFNHQQTQELLNSGRVMSGGGHARAYAKGTLSIPAHAGTGMAHSTTPLANWNKNRTQVGNTSANTNAEKANTDAKKKNTNETNNNTKAVKKSKTTFDWVEKRITYWGDKVKAIADKINDYIDKSLKQTRLSAQMKQMEYQIGSNEKGQRKYMKKAESVAKSYTYYDDKGNAVPTSVSKYYQKLVQKGSYKIEDMDTSTTKGKALVEAINEYQKWYEKAKNCGQAISDLRNEQLQLFEQWANMPTEKATDALEKIQKGFAGIEATETRLNAANSGGSTQKAMVNAMTSAADEQAAKKSESKAAYDKAKTAADKKKTVLSQKQSTLASAKGLTKAQKKAIAEGKYVDPNKIKNKSTKSIVKQYNSARTAYAKAKDKQSSAKAKYNTNKNMGKSMNGNLAEAKAGYNSGNELSYMNGLVDAGVAQKQQSAQIQNQAWAETITNKNKYQSEYDKYLRTQKTYSDDVKKGKSIATNKKYSSKLTNAQKAALKAGKTVSTKGVTDKTLLKELKNYNTAVKKLPESVQNLERAKAKLNIVTKAESEAATNAANAETEAAQATVDAVKTKFENAKNYYEGLLGYQEQIGDLSEKSIDFSNAHGNYEKTTEYDTKISNVQANRAIKQQEVDSLTNELNQGVASGTIVEGSQEWIDMKTQIVEAQNAVGDYDTKIEELKQQQIGVYYEEQFTRAIDKIEQFKDRLDALKGIITDDMKIDKNSGLLTEMGALSLTLNRDQFRSNNEELSKLFAERRQIESDFRANKFGEKDYDSKMKEVQSSINNLISSNSSLQQEALTLIKDQAQAELDVLNKVIDKRKEALKAKKDYYDYDKTLKDQTKDIQLLERQIAALEGSTNAEDKARKARLQEQLSDAKDKRSDTIVEHAYSLQTDSLDKLSTDMSEDFEKWSNNISSNIEEMSKAINEAVANAGQSTSQVITNLSTILRNVGLNDDQISQVTQGVTGYASGTDYVNKSGVYRINENGMELINSKKYGLLTYLNQGDSVIDTNMSKRILENAASATSNNFPVLQKAAQDLAQAINTYNTNQSLSPIMNVTINIDGAKDPALIGQEVRKQLNAYGKQMKKDFFTLR